LTVFIKEIDDDDDEAVSVAVHIKAIFHRKMASYAKSELEFEMRDLSFAVRPTSLCGMSLATTETESGHHAATLPNLHSSYAVVRC